MWTRKYVFLALNLSISAFLELAMAVTAELLVNNLFIDYLFVPVDFTLVMLYLSSFHQSKKVSLATFSIIVLFILFQIVKAVDENGYLELNTLGAYVNSLVVFLFSFWNLSILFKRKNFPDQLRRDPNLWFTGTILAICFVDFATTVLASVTYADGNADAFFRLYIPRNIIYLFLLSGYGNGLRLIK